MMCIIMEKKYTTFFLKGEGIRKVDLHCIFNREDLIKYAVKSNIHVVLQMSVTYELGNFKQEPVTNLVDSSGAVQCFTF